MRVLWFRYSDGVEKLLAELLEAKFLKNAQVTVFILEYLSNRVAVIGAVEKPAFGPSVHCIGVRTPLRSPR